MCMQRCEYLNLYSMWFAAMHGILFNSVLQAKFDPVIYLIIIMSRGTYLEWILLYMISQFINALTKNWYWRAQCWGVSCLNKNKISEVSMQFAALMIHAGSKQCVGTGMVLQRGVNRAGETCLNYWSGYFVGIATVSPSSPRCAAHLAT